MLWPTEGYHPEFDPYAGRNSKPKKPRKRKPRPELYGIWRCMLYRCDPKNAAKFPRYAGRGITVDQAWQSFEQFVADIGPRPTPGHTVDRINNDLGYGPGNCRWATWEEQERNKEQPSTFLKEN